MYYLIIKVAFSFHDIMEYLLEKGADPNYIKDPKKDFTCLFIACSQADTKAIEILIKYKATNDVINKY